MDDLNIFAKSGREVNILVFTVQILINDTEMRFGIKRYEVLSLKRRKAVSSEAVQMSGGERIKEVEKNRYNCLGILDTKKSRKAR